MARPNLAGLRKAAGSARAPIANDDTLPVLPTPVIPAAKADKAAITVHLPKVVRLQLKALSAEQDRTMEDLVCEALNMMFAHYGKPEVAPRKFGD